MKIMKLPGLLLASVLITACVNPNYRCSNSCTDDDITTSVQVKINTDRCMSDQFIHVKTYERVVTLTGRVSTPTQKKIATNMAQSVLGVKYVKNQLEVKALY